jgi:organic radical activating enzyme
MSKLRTAFDFDPERLKIIEVYNSIQGEGIDIGSEVIFVRTSGCNLSCVWCDTKHSWTGQRGDSFTPGELLRKVIEETKGAKSVIITGGEPFVQPPEPLTEFVISLKALGYHVAWETNGLHVPDDTLIELTDLFTVSPKLHSSEQIAFPVMTLDTWAARAGAEGKVQFKFVIGSEEDMAEAVYLITHAQNVYHTESPIVFQPEESKDKEIYAKLPEMAARHLRGKGDNILKYYVRYIPQTHKHYKIR